MVDFFLKAFESAPQWVILLLTLFIIYEMKNKESNNKERHENTIGAIAGVKSDVSAMKSRMDCFEKSQHSCQLENAKNFATKEDVDDVYAKVGDLDRRVSRIEGSR